jgi:hypothetical protein
MRVLCVDNEYVGLSVTKGKWYELVDSIAHDDVYDVIGDRGTSVRIDSKKFRTVEQLREERLKELLNL